jgi:predicted NBD/HSP70 family sugar kinase
VINALRRNPGRSQTELAHATGLAVPTIASIVRQLVDKGVIHSMGAQAQGRGRPRISLALNPSAGFGIGVHLDPLQTSITVLDLAGTTRELRIVDGAPAEDPQIGVARIATLITEMIRDAKIDRSRILGVGVATPGPIDLANGRLMDPPWLPGWRDFPLVDALSTASGFDVHFQKDTIAAITGERWLRVDDDDDSTMLFLYHGMGVGMGLAIGGEVVRGSSGNAGEIGGFFEHPGTAMRLNSLSLTDPASLCRAAASRGASHITRLLGAHADGPRPPSDVIDVAFRELCRAASAGDETCVNVLSEAARALGEGIRLIAGLLDADRVVLGGPSWAMVSTIYEPIIRERCSSWIPGGAAHDLELSVSVMGAEAGAIGAAALVLDDHYVPHAASLSAGRSR